MYEDKPMDRRPFVGTSILVSIKKLLGLDIAYNVFDEDIMLFINSTILSLRQIGVEIPPGFTVKSDIENWEDMIGDTKRLEAVKSYIFIKVKLMFDPPTSSFVIKAYEDQLKELEWRINAEVDKAYQNNPKKRGERNEWW